MISRLEIEQSIKIIEGDQELREFWINNQLIGSGTSNHDNNISVPWFISSGEIKGTNKVATIIQYEI